ncbi:MAG: DUF5674 family protein [Patescibacteria group bacterium]
MKTIDIKDGISVAELKEMAKIMFGNLVKAVVDIEKEMMVIDGELHADEEALLLENGSEQKDLWGINIYPEVSKTDWIEFDSMINIRPALGNNSRSVDDSKTREKILAVVNKLLKE